MIIASILLNVLWLIPILAAAASDIPACFTTCYDNATAETDACNPSDIQCLCENSTYISSLSCCLSTACGTNDQLAAVQESQSICSAVGVSVPDFVGCSPYPISSVSSVATSATRTSANAVTSASATQTSAAGGSRSSSKSSSIIPIAIGASLGGAFLAVVCLLLCLRVHKTRRMQQHSQFTITRPDQSRDHAIETPQTPAIELPAGHSVPTFHARSPIEAEEGSPARLQEMTGTSAFQEMLGSTSLHEHHPAFSGESPQDGIQALENGIGPPPYPSSEIPETSRPESVKGIRTAFPVPPSTQQAPAILGQDMRYLYNLESTSSSPVSPARASQLIVSEISEIPMSPLHSPGMESRQGPGTFGSPLDSTVSGTSTTNRPSSSNQSQS